MQYQQGDYQVVGARPLDGGPGGGEAEVPPALRDAFVGRRFTRQHLEAMGVDIRGDKAVAHHEGGDWELLLAPNL